MTQETTTANKPSVLSLTIKERAALYAAYMPFIQGGGLFIPTDKDFSIGEPKSPIGSRCKDKWFGKPRVHKPTNHVVLVYNSTQIMVARKLLQR